MGIGQQTVDKAARTFYSALAIAGCVSSLAFIALGIYGVASESVSKSRLLFAGLAAMGILVGTRSVRFLKYVWTHDDLPEDE